MTVDEELAAWGEPPVSPDEEPLLAFLDHFLEKRARGELIDVEELVTVFPGLPPEGPALARTATGLEELVASVLDHSSVQHGRNAPPDAPTELFEQPTLPEGFPGPAPAGFRVRACIGEGCFSKVWLADHQRLGIPVALKALHLGATEETRALALGVLQSEARALARLNHPNIVRVYGLEQVEGEHYLVLQFVDGGSLQARLTKDGPLGWETAARYLADVGEALIHVHAAGVVHRDIKPANILWDSLQDEALLTDFGLATRLTETKEAAGTPLYMAPEAFAGRSTPASEVYGLAATLFALVTGQVPFPAMTRRELLERIQHGLPDREPLFAGVPEALERLIRAGLAAAPERRPELPLFVETLRGALNQLLADSLLLPTAGTTMPAAVDLRLRVSRLDSRGGWTQVASTHPEPAGLTRDMTKVPPKPEYVGVRTGDRVRVEVLTNRDGFVTVFNVGPTGQLNLLHPDPDASAAVQANRNLQVLDVALTPPAGRERLFAVWSQAPLPLSLADLVHLTQGSVPVSACYRSTRNMERVQASVQQLHREDWQATVLELDHRDC